MKNEQYDVQMNSGSRPKGDDSWRQRVGKTPLVRFIKAYPRVSTAVAVFIGIFFMIWPGSGEDKMTIILRTIAIGFLIAFGFYCFNALRQRK